MELPRLSFCTTCMGRLHHVKETLPCNLEQVRYFPQVELVLVDYSSPDGLHEWLIANYAAEIRSGRIRYLRVPGQTLFYRSHARNVAWKNATGEFLVNLDADVALQAGAVEGIYQAFLRPGNRDRNGVLFVDSDHVQLDLWGCIGAHRDAFLAVGGYNEAFGARWGLEDDDYARRLAEFGVLFFALPHAWLKAIQHSDEERVKFHTEDRESGLELNKQIQQQQSGLAGYRANVGREWGVGGVQVLL